MKRTFLLSAIYVLFLIPCLAQQSKSLANKEKAQIIKAILLDTDFVNSRLLTDEKRKNVYLSTENIPSKFAPKTRGINFLLVSPQQVKEKANTLFEYYAFQEFKDEGLRVLVSFSQVYQDTRIRCSGCTGSGSSSHGIRYEFRKIKGKWQGTKLNGYASGS